MVSNPEGLIEGGVTARLQKAERDHTLMAGIIANGKDAELGNEEIFSIVVGSYPAIFDGLVQGHGTVTGVQLPPTGPA
eukprot:12845387-Heterocapsa_arctica.AAC.1